MNSQIFTTIQTFVGELTEQFEDNKPLALYNHLLTKTTTEHSGAINKHINIFKDFCITNRGAIESNNIKMFEESNIMYSDKVFINIRDIILDTDDESKQVIWKHLMVLSAYLDKESIAKDMLMARQRDENESVEPKDCTNFITNMVDDISKKLDIPEDKDNINIGEIMGKMVSSGAITDIFTSVQNGMQNGDLDLPGLLNSAKDLMSTEAPEGAPDMGEMINTVMGSLSGAGVPGAENANPDMMSMMMNMMASFQHPHKQE